MTLFSIEELKAITKQKCLTYADLSARSGIPQGSLKQLFSGRIPNPGYDTVCAIYRALGLDDDSPATEPDIVRVYDALSDRGRSLLMGYAEGLLAAEDKDVAFVLSTPGKNAQKMG